MRVAALLLALVSACSGACSGDDTHRHSNLPHPPATSTGDGAAAAQPGVPGSFSESAAQSYWVSADEVLGSQSFALADYPAATAAFAKARAATKDPERIARIELMLGLCAERSNDATTASTHFLAAYAKLPQLADYIGYHAARTLWLAHKSAEATELAQKIAKDSIVGPDAEILLGDLLRGQAGAKPANAGERGQAGAKPANAGERGQAGAKPANAGERGQAGAKPANAGERGQAGAKPANAGERGQAGAKPANAGERGSTDWAAVAAHYRDYLTRHPNGPFRSEARFELGDAIEQSKGAPAEALALYKQITIDDPLSSWTTKAMDRLTALNAPPVYTAAEQIARGMELFDAMRNPESEAAFAAALADPAISPADKCIAAYHQAQSRFKARDRQGASTMFDAAVSACAGVNTDLQVKSAYQAGRSYAFLGQHQTAIDRYKATQTIDPKHSYADDGMLREAEEWLSLNDGKKVDEVLSALPKAFPDGDNVAEAMWRIGWRAWREQRYDDAIKWWQEQIKLVPRDDNYFGEGQAQYWLGRAYQAKNDMAKAIAQWQETVRTYPAAYYSLQALNRLRETSPKDFEKQVAEISADPAGFDPKAPAFTFKPRVEWNAPGFLRAMEFLRLGIGSAAEAELKKVGLSAPEGKKRVTDPDLAEKLWAMAFLYDKAGRHATSLWPTRWHILDYRTQWPVGANRARWLIAYPKGYWNILTRHAALNSVPIAMQIGIVREESGFDPLTESYANAIGLTQMIPPTAKDYSKGTGIDPTRENLRDPEKNVTIGSRFLGALFKRWKNFVLLVPPSYNAGPAAVTKMLRVRGTWASDEFIEGIVDDQARNYSKRVLGSFFTYSWLYEHTIPEVPNTIPSDLLPK